jgi:tRNA-dihydrouridine synthase B
MEQSLENRQERMAAARPARALRIGNLHLGEGLILAPMAGITDLSFRLIARRFGAALVTSEMVSADGVLRANASTRSLLRSHPEERPLAVQLFGGSPEAVAEAARIVAGEGADLIDLNMGCGVPKVVSQGAGAALLLDPDRVGRMVDAVRQAVTVPVTVKIRSGWSKEQVNAVEVARRAEDAGADAVTIHPRTARQGFAGAADWEVIAKIKAAVSIPVIGNGDVRQPEQVEKMRTLTGCDGVMIGRAAMGNPWIFRQAKQLAGGGGAERPLVAERLEVMLEHLRLHQEHRPNRPLLAGVRSLLIWYSRGLTGSSGLRAGLAGCGGLGEMLDLSTSFFAAQAETGC